MEIINFPGSEPSLRLVWAQISQIGKIPSILRVYLKTPGLPEKIPGFLPVSSILPQILPQCPDQLSDSKKQIAKNLSLRLRETREFSRGKLERKQKQNGAPNTLWLPWKFPETKSAGDPLVSFLVSGNMGTGQQTHDNGVVLSST